MNGNEALPGAAGLDYDDLIIRLADYAVAVPRPIGQTLQTAALCLTDAVACAIAALREPDCARRLGPWVEGSTVADGVPVWGTDYVLDPVKAAQDIGSMIRWLDFSDTSFVGGHPSDCIGALLAAADHTGRQQRGTGKAPTMGDVYAAMVGAYEIQGLLAAANHFDHPSIGLDHVVDVKLACAAMATRLLGGDRDTIAAAVSNGFLDGQALNAYRHVPNAGSRKSWAGGDAAGRGVWLALSAMKGEMGYPRPLSAPVWGFEAVYMDGRPVTLAREPGSFVLDNVIFKLHPCQRNTTTAVESALRIHTWLAGRVDRIRRISIRSQDEAVRRTDKSGPLPNRAARDHSMQYVVAVALIHGRLAPDDYSDAAAADPRIDRLRERTVIVEDAAYTRDHHDLRIRSCANSVQVELDDGSCSALEETLFPAGDPTRRAGALPALHQKFDALTRHHWPQQRRDAIFARMCDAEAMQAMPVADFMDLLAGAA
ncbi:MAG: 2-methylcitrate dehydratase [Betaproteobacteria bacterium]|nr:2-methylcitrate dehydratase [Betaproteobacteria bacterium]